jgi:alkylhydroperoxidase family enzyme
MERMFLPSVEQGRAGGSYASTIEAMTAAGAPVPQIMRLFAFKPASTDHLAHYTHAAMRGPSPLSPGLRELIAAYTSKLNHCPF